MEPEPATHENKQQQRAGGPRSLPGMGGGAVVPPPTASWRALAAAALALWLVPVVLALAVLWLPLLCCAAAAVRFRRVRKSRACGGRGGPWREEITGDDAGDRARLLHRYLRDQMELVVAGAGAGDQLELPDQ
ncbi:uncharacterized protein LOC120663715 [Panicum virgatum]|uniref:Uncharacterized protein n=1 Tax=Panicum virgatum TaxID=38727 RepID=A0A8T0TZB9_PANVG|nr:uncharacterized protein LOC120663715 [Panicum virgatum]KAG2615118.1 hypothetical protein PVAP13_3NG031900 [Panicum virgatum]